MSEQFDDFTMAYQDSCDRLPLVLIHGFPLDGTLWELQIDEFQDMTRVIAPDLRGHGRSDPAPPPYTMSQLADDIAGLLDYLGIMRPAIICGLSMGGYVAFEFYRRYRERVAGLILTATRAGADTKAGKAGRDEMAQTVQQEGVEPIVEGMLPKLMAPVTYEDGEELVTFVREMMLETSAEGMVGALMAMKEREDSTVTLAEIDAPTLIIHGEEDQIVPLTEAEAMAAAIANAELVVVPDAGHLPNLEQPDIFNDAVLDFLEGWLTEDGHGH